MTVNAAKILTVICLIMPAAAAMAIPTTDGNAVTNYNVTGTVETIAPDRHQASIHNQTIPGYMMAMTMNFTIKDTNELAGVSPGDEITFTLAVTKNDSWIQNIHRTGKTDPVAAASAQAPATLPELKPGDTLPDGALTAEDGRQIHFSDFRGKALAFTFFYTRCPLPNYCPLMNRNFATARDILSSRAGAPTNWQFLSVSFDAQNDTPQVLTTFGGYYRNGHPGHWLFASADTDTLKKLAPALDLMVFREGATISHNLRTVVLDTHGRIYQQFDGNQWTPQDLVDAILSAADH